MITNLDHLKFGVFVGERIVAAYASLGAAEVYQRALNNPASIRKLHNGEWKLPSELPWSERGAFE